MKILVTGASRGIGLFLMRKFLDEGYSVSGIYNRTIPPSELESYFSKVDIRNTDEVIGWINSSLKENEKIVLINCAGGNYNAVAHKADVEKWKTLIDVNLVGPFRVINSVLPHMRATGWGRIINFSSIVAQKGIPGTSAYAASKSALWGMSRSIAVENAKKGITINNLNLGYYDIGMITEVPSEMLEAIKKTIPVQHLGDPENIYNAVKFLIESDYITGTSLDINGGLF